MALRNAFEALATERTLRLLTNNLTLARDTVDRLRVIVDGGSIAITTQNFGNNNAVPSYFTTGSHLSMDPRETHRQASLMYGEIARQKWVIT